MDEGGRGERGWGGVCGMSSDSVCPQIHELQFHSSLFISFLFFFYSTTAFAVHSSDIIR